MKKWLYIGLLTIAALPLRAFAVDLIDVYRDALGNDPTFKAAEAQYLANKENLPIARSYLLPNINVQGETLRQHIQESPVIVAEGTTFPLKAQKFYNTSNIYQLNISQPIFNYSAWFALRNASFQVKQAEATFAGSAQDLMMRTAQAYFAVMQASDTLRYTLAQKRAVGQQLNQARQQYNVGLIAITAVSEAQANYDSIVANEIAARDNLAVAMEQLRTITSKTYPQMMGVSAHLPLVRPNPADMEQWVNIAECQNYSLRAAIENTNAAGENIEVQRGGHFPVINAVGDYNYNQQSNPGQFGFEKIETTEGGVSVNFPIYEGGLVNAQTKQANFLYQQAISNMEFTHRSVLAQAREAYLGVITGINKIQADREAIISAQISLKATQQGYEVGTRTILDVLNTQSALYQAQINYSTDQYSYLTNILTLKEAAGTLSPSDLVQMNAWLNNNVDIAHSIANVTEATLNPNPASTPSLKKQAQMEKSQVVAPTISKKKTLSSKAATQEKNKQQSSNSAKKSSHKSKQQKISANAKTAASTPQTISKKNSSSNETKQNKQTSMPLNKVEQQKVAELHKEMTTSQPKSGQITRISTIGYYVIELFDTRYEQHAKDFIKVHNIASNATYITIHNDQGEARYQVIYGKYKTLAAAEKALKQLPASLQNLNPWIRKITSDS